MSSITSTVKFLAKIPLYEDEKPYFIVPLANSSLDPDSQRLTNLQFDEIPLNIQDARGKDLHLEKNGFQVEKHVSQNLEITTLEKHT